MDVWVLFRGGHFVRDAEVASSNLVAPTIAWKPRFPEFSRDSGFFALSHTHGLLSHLKLFYKMFYKTTESALCKLSLAVNLEQACCRPRNLTQVILCGVKALLIVMRVNLQRGIRVGMTQPILKLLDVPASIDEHRCAGMTEFVVSNIGTSVSFHGLFKIFRYPARVIPAPSSLVKTYPFVSRYASPKKLL